MTEDGLSSNAPHIEMLQAYGCHYILGVKEGDHGYLFAQVHAAEQAGQVDYLDGYIVGRQQVRQFYSRLERAYPKVELIYVIQDNWNIHTHPDVLTALEDYPRIIPVWLPTYAPWLNPIEKLWRWLRQDLLKMHRWVEDWPRVKQRVPDFLAQFAYGSAALLRYVGLMGKGKLATVIHTS